MLTMDVFNSDMFSATSMTAAVDRYGYVPSYLQSIPGLIVPVPVSTEDIWIEARANAPALIQTSLRGEPPKQKGGDQRDARGFKTRRLALSSRITASQLQNIRGFGSTTELMSLQMEVGRRQFMLKQDMQLTKEFWTLGMIQGKVIDANGDVIYDWNAEFNQAQPDEIAFNFANAEEGDIVTSCNLVTRTMIRNLQGLGGNGVSIRAACGDQFWDQLTTADEVRDTYKAWQAAQDLRNEVSKPWSVFQYGGIGWFNYRGTDDNSTVAIPPSKAKFFPVNSGIFQWALAPSERFEFVNTPGLDAYSWIVRDIQRNMYADVEESTYPLAVCVQPKALMSGRSGA